MQTFLPYADFDKSAQCLDRSRLGKQRVEAWQILLAITGRSSGWRQHPATRMWSGCPAALVNYSLAMINEWVKRGYRDSLAEKFIQVALEDQLDLDNAAMPFWLGDERVHSSHRSNLLRKDAAHYGQFGWAEAATLPYYWPTISPLLPPMEGIRMSEQSSTPATPSVFSVAEQTIREQVEAVKATIDPAIGEKNVARAHKRLGNIAKNAGIALGRLEKQTKRALRPKRVKKTKSPATEAAETAEAAQA